jgi:hypothetical protein
MHSAHPNWIAMLSSLGYEQHYRHLACLTSSTAVPLAAKLNVSARLGLPRRVSFTDTDRRRARLRPRHKPRPASLLSSPESMVTG